MNSQDLSRMKSPLFYLPSPLLHLHHDPKSVSLPELLSSYWWVPMTVRKGARLPASEPSHYLFYASPIFSCSFSFHRRSSLSLPPSQPRRKVDLQPTPTTATISFLAIYHVIHSRVKTPPLPSSLTGNNYHRLPLFLRSLPNFITLVVCHHNHH